MIFQGNALYPVREAVLHCAAIKTGQFKGWSAFQVFSEINRWHIKRGFKNGFGYHGLFMPDGSYYSGRPYTQIGAHVIDHNRGTLGFLMIESLEETGCSSTPPFRRTRSSAQRPARISPSRGLAL